MKLTKEDDEQYRKTRFVDFVKDIIILIRFEIGSLSFDW